MKLLKFKNYMAMINGSVDSNAYQHIYAIDDKGEEKDITEDGALSCAYFVSSILLIQGLIKSVHATVNGTIQDMADSGWQEISQLKEGAVILWEADQEGSGLHMHIGFYIGDKLAISNSSTEYVPKIHDTNYGERNRKIISIWLHEKLTT